jgi:DNA-binding LacI/PurR family transcriptional regulator
MAAVRVRGLRIPEDLSITGFDDMSPRSMGLAAADHGAPAVR